MRGCGRTFGLMEEAERHEAGCDGTPVLKKGAFVLVVRTGERFSPPLPLAGRGFDGTLVSVRKGVVEISNKGSASYYARMADVKVIA